MDSTHKRLANSEDGPDSLLVLNETLNSKLKSIILSFWPERKNDYFPAPQPVSLERRDLFKIKKFPYLVCVKSDGMRFLMLCVNVKGTNKCYMVDRAFRFYEVEHKFPNDIYKTTLFDGELIKCNDNKWSYIIHDCISYKGKSVKKETFPVRYKCVVETVESGCEEGSFGINIKVFRKFKDMDEFVRDMNEKKFNHKIDGIIFTPQNLPVGMHTQYTLFKWKPRDLHTFDFKILIKNNSIIAQVNDKRSLTDFASVDMDTENGKDFYSKLQSLKEFKNGSIVECTYNEVTQCYDPLLVRVDKTHPNGLFTVDKTLLNIKENITVNELLQLSEHLEN